ncbi:hypothetical protein ACHWQZ_G002476 [Mnemiopsis leidyi]
MGRGGELIEGIDNDYLNSIASYKHILPKLIWTVLFSGMLTLGIYCSIELVRDYMDYPSYTEISSQFTTEFHFPAITICNINRLNRTLMEESTIGNTNTNVYDLYSELMEETSFRSKSKGGVKNPKSKSKGRNKRNEPKISYEVINNMNVYRNFKWNIYSTLDKKTLTFAKDNLANLGDTFKVDLTEMGNCLEINDNQALVQKVNGPVGGLSMILDAQTDHYVRSTESEGFYIVLRMANESVISKEYAFAVSPGKETFIQLETTEVTRLRPPYGSCQDTSDLFHVKGEEETPGKISNPMTIKECFTGQVLWQFMKEPQCKCYPWYIYSRHIDRTVGKPTRNIDLEAQLYRYFTSDLPQEKRIEFDNTTCYFQDELSYSGTTLATFESVQRVEGCADRCKTTENCVYFNWADALEQCDLFGEGAELTADLDYRVTRGNVSCSSSAMEFHECSLTVEAKCNNLMIDLMMSGEDTQKPMECHEPCTYNKTTYTLSSTNFPSKGIWDSSLAAAFPHYKTFEDAKRNLVKLVFYQELMTRTEEVQTAAYNWRSFVGELGGVLDLFVGISVLTGFRIIEWLLCLVWKPRKRVGSESKLDVMNMNSSPTAIS